jgi:hypothetical protein
MKLGKCVLGAVDIWRSGRACRVVVKESREKRCTRYSFLEPFESTHANPLLQDI